MTTFEQSLSPYASAEAAKTVEKHKDPQELTLYAAWWCPFVQRTWIALEERGIPYQYSEVNPYHKEKHFLAINPKGLVPAIEYKGKALSESLIICEFLEDAYPSYKPNLLPLDPTERAYARIWIDFASKSIVPNNFKLLTAQDPEKQQEILVELTTALKQFAEKIKGPFFLGEEFSLVDIAVASWIVRDYVLREHRGFRREDVGAKWVEYAKRVETRESVVKTSSDRERYSEIYARYLRDKIESQVAKAIRAGRVIP